MKNNKNFQDLNQGFKIVASGSLESRVQRSFKKKNYKSIRKLINRRKYETKSRD